ncbi:MAG: hypothetical protein M0P94_03105 [Candidatus Absconditabacterales bacterium]|nr:hypothetical protein [Candidatus Absconditabacterales bacterium]
MKKIIYFLLLPLELLGRVIDYFFDYLCLGFTIFTTWVVYKSLKSGILFKEPIQYMPLFILFVFVVIALFLIYLWFKKHLKD